MAGIAGQLQQPVQDILAESVQVRPKRKRGQTADFFESVMCRDAVEHVEVYVCADDLNIGKLRLVEKKSR